jgi:predicted ATPase/DNA-binding winged helix-turn-helix (wHTH) protein/class 3 adenylate cyclase
VVYAFADCELDTRRRELRRAGVPVAIEPQVFDVLAYLVGHGDRVVPRDELLDRVWGHRFVADATLSSRVASARRAVGDDGQRQRLIRTLFGRGFRFVGEVAVRDGAPAGGVDRAPMAPAAAVTAPVPVLPVAPGAAGGLADGAAGRPLPGSDGAGAPEDARPLPPTGLVTFLLARLEGGTLLLGGGPGAYRESVDRARALLGEAVAARGGVVFRGAGDAVAAAFDSPAAAVAAALAGQVALEQGAWSGAPPLRARLGLHTGEAARAGTDYAGEALVRCARLAAVAGSGQVVLSEATAALARDALPDGTALEDLGAHRLVDVPRPVRLFRLVHPRLPAPAPGARVPGPPDDPGGPAGGGTAGVDGAGPEPGEGQAPPAHNLPRPLSGLVGREQEAVAVRRLVAARPLVTLAGPGGAGKTRLALRVAADVLAAPPGADGFPDVPDGVWFVDLAPLADGALVPQAVAAAVGVPEMPGQELAATLADTLRPRALLLLLDNCEHVVDACAHLAAGLLRAAPRLRVLATSREPLRAVGEAVYRVPPLAAPGPGQAEPPERVAAYPAVRLFVERARAVRPGFAVTAGNAAAVAHICGRLDGVPLALELAAARVRVLSAEQLAARLSDRLALLTGGERTAHRRHQTLRATLDWSYDLLAGAERALLRRLTVFAGGFSLAGAEAVGADAAVGQPDGAGATGDAVGLADVLDLLTSLVDRSLVAAEAGPVAGGEGEEVRYRLLETVRQYAAERLAENGEAARVRGAHARHFLALAERALPELQGPGQARWHARLEAEHDNLRAALAWYVEQRDGAHALRLTGALRWFWYRRRHWEEGYVWPARVLALPGAQAPTPQRAAVLQGAGLFAMWRDPAAAQAMWEESAEISLANGAPDRAAATGAHLAWLLLRRGDLETARAQAEAALALAREADDPAALSNALALLAAVAARQGHHAAARARHEEALALRRASGDVSGRSLLLLDMAKAAFLAGDGARARALAEEALRTAREAGIRQAVEEELRLIARVALAAGDLATAEARAAELVADARGRGAAAEADALPVLAQVAQAAGDGARAAALYREALEHALRLPDPGEEHPVLYRDTNDPPGAALALEGTAALLAPDRPALALRLAGAAATLRERTRQPLTADEREALDRRLGEARGRFGPAEAARLWARGADAATAEAISLALGALAGAAPPLPASDGAEPESAGRAGRSDGRTPPAG